jgi:hypothetical protein
MLGKKATTYNGRVGHELLKIKALERLEITFNKSNWHIMINEALRFKQSIVFVTKDEIIQYIREIMHSEVQ